MAVVTQSAYTSNIDQLRLVNIVGPGKALLADISFSGSDDTANTMETVEITYASLVPSGKDADGNVVYPTVIAAIIERTTPLTADAMTDPLIGRWDPSANDATNGKFSVAFQHFGTTENAYENETFRVVAILEDVAAGVNNGYQTITE